MHAYVLSALVLGVSNMLLRLRVSDGLYKKNLDLPYMLQQERRRAESLSHSSCLVHRLLVKESVVV